MYKKIFGVLISFKLDTKVFIVPLRVSASINIAPGTKPKREKKL